MRNILRSPLPESEIAALLAATFGQPALPLLDSPEWLAAQKHPAVAAWLGSLLIRVEAELADPMPALTDALYADFYLTGDRLPFERPYFERRRRLGRVAIAILLGPSSDRMRYLPSFLEKLTAIADEESWALPAHVWTNPTGKNPWLIDLFTAETANQLAEILVVFAPLIPAVLSSRIRTRLRSQIFENYAAPRADFSWFKSTNNWNAVCHQGVLGAALAIEEDHSLVARMLSLASARLPAFLDGYGNDGSTSEGPGYWSYGFGWFAELNAQLEHRTQRRLSLFAEDPKIEAIARFAPQMTFREGHLVNFSDGGRKGRLAPALLAYLGTRFADPQLSAQAASLFRHHAKNPPDLDFLRCDFFHLTRLALRTPAPDFLANADDPVQPDIFFPDYGALVARGTDACGHLWEFAAKAGHNDEHHNHNDCGSFILNLDGAPVLTETGAPEYTRAFFSDQRYENIAARSLGHSVPLVNGHEQTAGRAFTSTVLRADLGSDLVELSIDLAKAYPPSARIRSLRRDFVLEKKAGRLTVTDTCELDTAGTFESVLITESPVSREDDALLVTSNRATLRIAPSPGAQLVAIETVPYRGHQGSDEKLHRLRLCSDTAPVATHHRIACVITVKQHPSAK